MLAWWGRAGWTPGVVEVPRQGVVALPQVVAAVVAVAVLRVAEGLVGPEVVV